MKPDDLIKKLQELDAEYIEFEIGLNPAMLPTHLAKYNGYLTMLNYHYANAQHAYDIKSAEVTQEELVEMERMNEAQPRSRTASEKDDRIKIRMKNYTAQRNRLKIIVEGCSDHVNRCQSLIKQAANEAKGIM